MDRDGKGVKKMPSWRRVVVVGGGGGGGGVERRRGIYGITVKKNRSIFVHIQTV